MEYEKIILDLMQRVMELEKEVKELKKWKEDFDKEDDDSDSWCSACMDMPKINDSGFASSRYNDLGARATKDKTKYMFKGVIYPKNRLVLAVVTDYVKNHPSITEEELKEVFNKSLQGSIGVVEDIETAKTRSDYNVRFFAESDEVLNVADGKMIVCTQWGITNIGNFLFRARMLGYEIEEIINDSKTFKPVAIQCIPISDHLSIKTPYGTAAKKVFLECCDVFGFNSLQADEFVWGHPLYAGKSTKEGYGVWFISRSNLNYEPNESNWIDEFNDNGNYIIEHWKELYSLGLSIYENSDTRVVFAKIAGYYQFMGVYKCAEVNIEKRYKRYDRISKVYPIE